MSARAVDIVPDMPVEEAAAFAADGCDRFTDARNFIRLAGQLQAWEALQRQDPATFRGLLQLLPRAAARELEISIAAMRGESPAENWPGDGAVGEMLRSAPPDIQFLVPNRLVMGRAASLVAPGGAGKTQLQLSLAVGAVVGRTTFGWSFDRTGSACLVLGENTPAETHRAVARVADALDLDDAERDLVAERLRIWSLGGQQSTLLAAEPLGALGETWRVEALRDEIHALPDPVVLIGLDPAIALSEGDELNAIHQRRLGEFVDRMAIDTGAAVLLAVHAAKGLLHIDEVGSHASRGSGALTDAVRAEFVMRTMTAKEATEFHIDTPSDRRRYVQLAATKGNELPPEAFEPEWLMRGPGGVLLPADLEPGRVAPHIGRREEQALEILREMAKTSMPRLAEWREACIKAGLLNGRTEAAQVKAMERVRDALLEANRIQRGTTKGYFIPTQGSF